SEGQQLPSPAAASRAPGLKRFRRSLLPMPGKLAETLRAGFSLVPMHRSTLLSAIAIEFAAMEPTTTAFASRRRIQAIMSERRFGFGMMAQFPPTTLL